MISFTTVTWYSRLLTIIFVFGIYPLIAFYIGTQFQQLLQELAAVDSAYEENLISVTGQ